MNKDALLAFLQKIMKSVAHASAGGGIALGAAKLDVLNADLSTIIYVVLSAWVYNTLREFIKTILNGNGTNGSN